MLLAQQLTQSVAGQGLNGKLHGTDALIQRQAAVHLDDEGSDLFLLILRAVDDGTNFLALLLHDALGDGRAEGQLLFQLFGADVLAAGEDDKVLLAAGDVIEAFLIHPGQVAGVEPAVGVDDLFRGLGVLVVAQHHAVALDADLAGLAALVLILIIIMIVNGVKMKKLKKKYEAFMAGKNAASLEDTLVKRLNQVEDLIASDEHTQEKVQMVLDHLDNTYQKVGLVKYDAFNEMGGKLSFSLALLNRKNNGFIINAMHSREGCYTYIKEIIDGNSVIMLAEEEKEALEMALADTYEQGK